MVSLWLEKVTHAVLWNQRGTGFENKVSRTSSLFLHESPWCNNYVYGTEGKNRGEERCEAHEEIEQERGAGGFSLPHRTKGKGAGWRLGHSTFQHYLRRGPTKFQQIFKSGDFSHRMRDSSSRLQSKYTKGNRKILSRHILQQTRAQRPVIFDISFFYLYTVQIAF